MTKTTRPYTAAFCRLSFGVVFVIALPTFVSAQAGALDPTFDVDGRVETNVGSNGYGAAIAIQSDGKIVVVGSNLNDIVTARYNTNGQLDGIFGGHFGSNQYASAVALQVIGGEQKIVVGGTFEYDDFIIVRYNADGTLDGSFNGVGYLTADFGGSEILTALAIQPDGKIVAVGDAYRNPAPPPNFDPGFNGLALARYFPDGTLDPSFGSGGKVLVSLDEQQVFDHEGQSHAIVVQADGKILVAGYIFDLFATPRTTDYFLARFTASGVLDPTFDSDGKAIANFGDDEYGFGLGLQGDGYIVAGGSGFSFGVTRFKSDGTVDQSFGTGGQAVANFGGPKNLAYSVAIQPNGKIVAAGFTGPGGDGDNFAVARFDPDGSPDETFGVDGKAITPFTVGGASAAANANGVAMQADGNIVAAGYAESDFALARYIGANTSTGTNVVVTPSGAVSLTFQNIVQAGDTAATTSVSGPAPPAGFSLGNPATYFDISTTAIFSGPIEVCISYAGITFVDETSLQLLHFDGTSWVNTTTSLDPVNDVICGSVSSLSPFIVAAPSVVSVIPATVDVQPSTINKKSNGSYVTVYIEFPSAAASPADIAVGSVTLSAVGETTIALGSPTAIGDGNGNGITDLMVKFDRATVQSWFTAAGEATLHVEGQLVDGRQFAGNDVVLVIK